MMRCWQISSSGGAAQGMFLINFLDVIIAILSLSIPTTDDAAMRFCYAARNASFTGKILSASNLSVGKMAHHQTLFSRNCGISVQPAAASLIGHHGNLRDGFTRRAASGSNSVPQAIRERFKSSASLRRCVFNSRVSDVGCVLLLKQSLALTTNAANCSWDRRAKAATRLPMCSNPFLE